MDCEIDSVSLRICLVTNSHLRVISNNFKYSNIMALIIYLRYNRDLEFAKRHRCFHNMEWKELFF